MDLGLVELRKLNPSCVGQRFDVPGMILNGPLPFREYDYLVIPRCTTYRLAFEPGSAPDLLLIEAKGNVTIPAGMNLKDKYGETRCYIRDPFGLVFNIEQTDNRE